VAVVFIVVPPAADGFVAIHQHVEPAAMVAVEVLHAESAAIARPFGEVLAGECERRRRQDVGDEVVRAQPLHEILGGVRGRLVHEDGAPVLLQRVGVGIGTQEGRAVTEVTLGVPHAERIRCSFCR
jgi:hypothetical protein